MWSYTGAEFRHVLIFCYYVKGVRPSMLKDNLVSSHEMPPPPPQKKNSSSLNISMKN
jgi:hypothetical protein